MYNFAKGFLIRLLFYYHFRIFAQNNIALQLFSLNVTIDKENVHYYI